MIGPVNNAILALTRPYTIPATEHKTLTKVRVFEERIRDREQLDFATEHVFHAGMYARTVRIPAGVIFTSVLIKRPTILILNGTCDVLVGDMGVRMQGYNVIACEAGRKTVYATITDVELTMIFPSSAKSVTEAEMEFTDEPGMLLSRTRDSDIVTVTGV